MEALKSSLGEMKLRTFVSFILCLFSAHADILVGVIQARVAA